jgi:hypothetical protein
VATTINADCMQPPLDDAEVMKRTRQVWRDAQSGKIEPWVGKRAVARTSRAEVVELCGLGRHGSDAHALLMLLRTEHGARCARGETFCIAAKRMGELQVIPGWHWKRYSVARDLLLKAGKIHLVVKPRNTGRGWLPAQYALVGSKG